MQRQIVLSDNGFPKYSRAHVAIFNTAAQWFLMQVSCLALYKDWDFSGFHEFFHNIMYGRWWKT